MNTTTRRFPRTLREAFPADHYASIQHYRSSARAEWWAGVVLAIALGVVFGILLVRGMTW